MKLSDYKDSLHKKGWYFCWKEASKILFPIRWVGDKATMNLLMEKKAFHYLKRRYQHLLSEYKSDTAPMSTPTKVIWVCWLQGEDQAPDLVKQCIASIRRHAGDCEVRVLTHENIRQYITIPDYITQALQQKRMQFATYSDYLRIALLARHGGIWIDATVMLTATIPNEITACPLFFFQSSPLSPSPIVGSSWFLSAQANNPIVCQTKYLFECYWQRERHLRHYYLFHLLLTIVLQYNDENRQQLTSIPYRSNAEVHRMQFALFDEFDETRFRSICDSAFCHKLTYKFKKGQDTHKVGTFYHHIVSTDI